MFEFDQFQWAALLLCGLMVGVSKTALPGISIVTVGLMANLFAGKASTGVLLPMLIFADIFAIVYYRRHAQWRHIIRLMPWTLTGIGTGFFAMKIVDDKYFPLVIGLIILVMIAVKLFQDWRDYKNGQIRPPRHWGLLPKSCHPREGGDPDIISLGQRPKPSLMPHALSRVSIEQRSHWAFASILGFSAGVTTMMANAAGPVMTIYFLAMGMDKNKFIGTAAWFFFLVNWIKVPLSGNLNLITAETLKLNAMLFPAILAGAVLGIVLLKRINQKWFNRVMMLIATAAAIKLMLG